MSWSDKENPYRSPVPVQGRMVRGPGLRFTEPLLAHMLAHKAGKPESVCYRDYDYQEWDVPTQKYVKYGHTHRLLHEYHNGSEFSEPPYAWGDYTRISDRYRPWAWTAINLDSLDLIPQPMTAQEADMLVSYCAHTGERLKILEEKLGGQQGASDATRMISHIYPRLQALIEVTKGASIDPDAIDMHSAYRLLSHLPYELAEYGNMVKSPDLKEEGDSLFGEMKQHIALLDKAMHIGLYRYAEQGLAVERKPRRWFFGR